MHHTFLPIALNSLPIHQSIESNPSVLHSSNAIPSPSLQDLRWQFRVGSLHLVTVTRGFLSYKGEIGNIYQIYGIYVYKYIYLEPKWPLFWLEKAWGGWPSKIEVIWVPGIFWTHLLVNQLVYIYTISKERFWSGAWEKKETTTIQVDAFSVLGLVKVEDGSLIQQVHIPHLKGKGKTSTQELPLKGAMLC